MSGETASIKVLHVKVLTGFYQVLLTVLIKQNTDKKTQLKSFTKAEMPNVLWFQAPNINTRLSCWSLYFNCCWDKTRPLKGPRRVHKAEVTVQNWMPLPLLPSLSSGGDQHMMPITLGTTSRIPPATPDLAGRPTWKRQTIDNQRSPTCLCPRGAVLMFEEADTDVKGELSGEVVHAAGMH